MKPLLLCILDGVGMRKEIHGNAFLQASTPNFDELWNKYPHSLLEASGSLVGLPEGQMGNSEVGHMNIGAGRIVYQPLELINNKIKNKEFFQNENILEVFNHVKNNKSTLHVFGLLSDGGIHSHINQLLALIDMIKDNNINKVYYHIFTDGRDTLPNSSLKYFDILQNKINEVGFGKIATISGRYYAMDRDNRWQRIKKAYDAICNNIGNHYSNYKEAIEDNYKNNITDEFIVPSIIDESGMVNENDGLIVFNFRPDRLRELFQVFTNPNFKEFERDFIPNLKLTTFFPVSEEVISKPAFRYDTLENTFGEYIKKKGLNQLRIAETEKYAHVTYYFNGGLGEKIDCDSILIPSPKVATYDLKPEMSAYLITDTLLEKMASYDVIILNYANGDMVGHTGNMEASIKAVEVLDECLGKIYNKIKSLDGILIVTADHGNCDYMLDDNDNVITSHSTSKVPFIVCKENYKLKDGKLADIAPTMLKLLNLEVPKEMTGDILIEE